MDESPSPRLIDQRLRNRIMEAIWGLARGEEEVRAIGFTEYFEAFYDFVPHRADGPQHANSAITAQEREAVEQVSAMLDAACDATPAYLAEEDFIKSGWPRRIQPIAERTLGLMLSRGRFDEEREEESPSTPIPWP